MFGSEGSAATREGSLPSPHAEVRRGPTDVSPRFLDAGQRRIRESAALRPAVRELFPSPGGSQIGVPDSVDSDLVNERIQDDKI